MERSGSRFRSIRAPGSLSTGRATANCRGNIEFAMPEGMSARARRITIVIGLLLAAMPLVLFGIVSAGTDNFRGDIAYPPMLIAAIPVLVLRTGVAKYVAGLSGLGMWNFMFLHLGMTNIAWLYVPSAMTMLLACVAPPPRQPDTENEAPIR